MPELLCYCPVYKTFEIVDAQVNNLQKFSFVCRFMNKFKRMYCCVEKEQSAILIKYKRDILEIINLSNLQLLSGNNPSFIPIILVFQDMMKKKSFPLATAGLRSFFENFLVRLFAYFWWSWPGFIITTLAHKNNQHRFFM